jgi:hypothetical protein
VTIGTILSSGGAAPASYFKTVLYTGTGAELAVSGVGFQPDLVWIKNRDSALVHHLFDSTRGATNYISSDTAGAVGTDSQSLKSFDVDGFTVGTELVENTSGDDYVSWNWVKDEEAFDIVSYTGNSSNRTISHNMSVAPEVMFIKRTGSSHDWRVFHTGTSGSPEGESLILNTISSLQSDVWNNTAPTSSVFSLGTDSDVNASGQAYIAYLWASKAGHSAMGGYTGDGNTTQTISGLGFAPSFVMVKKSSTSDNWEVLDTTRQASGDEVIMWNDDAVGIAAERVNFESDGFEAILSRGTNTNTVRYVYMAFK